MRIYFHRRISRISVLGTCMPFIEQVKKASPLPQ